MVTTFDASPLVFFMVTAMITDLGLFCLVFPSGHPHLTSMTTELDGLMTMEVLFMGTGTSSGLPLVSCLTRPPNEPQCACCTATRTASGGKNVRGNTGIVARCRNGEDEVYIPFIIVRAER
jgi:hypothetical protein